VYAGIQNACGDRENADQVQTGKDPATVMAGYIDLGQRSGGRKMQSRSWFFWALTTCVVAWTSSAHRCAAQPPVESESAAVAAQVGDHAIYESTVLRFLETRFPKLTFQEPALSAIRAHALEHLVHRAIIYQYLVATGQWVDQAAIQLDIETYEKQLQRADITLAQHLAEKKISREQFEFETGWRLSWKKYLDKSLTEANLAAYFAAHRRQFDGTELKVAQLLLKDDSEDARRELNRIYEQLQDNPGDWNNLVAQHSQAPSKDQGGELGWIAIDGPMPPDFTQAAFELEANQISQPVKTQMGMHLIKCLEVRPGKKGPLDSREELMASAKEFLFNKLANDHRTEFEIRYADNFPHLNASGEVVSPRK
jgi:parvulin-like peptidyl-prolyl isomerase